MAQIVSELQDLTYLSWAKTRQSSGTAGSFLKSYDDTGAQKVYYKLSDYRAGTGIVGHECVRGPRRSDNAHLARRRVVDGLGEVASA